MRHVKAQNPSYESDLHIRIAPALLERFRDLAAAEHRSVSGKLRLMIEREIARADEEVAA